MKFDRENLKKRFVEVRGYWDESLDGLLEIDPEFFEAYLQFTSVPWKRGVIDPKTKEFIYIAVYACATHLYNPAIKTHIQKAFEFGATKEEIIEVFQLVSALGIHTFLEGIPLLMDEIEKTGELNSQLNERQMKLKEDFMEKRGYWNEFWDGLLVLDDQSFEAYTKTSSIPWANGYLTPKQKEFIYIAGDASATHLFTRGWRHHIQSALKLGATKEEIMEVYQLTAEIGMDTFREGMPILIEELNKVSTSN